MTDTKVQKKKKKKLMHAYFIVFQF